MELQNVQWYDDKEISIFFDKKPCVRIRYPRPDMTILERNSLEKYPFENIKPLKVAIFDHKKGKSYKFNIREGYCWDGASINKMLWRIIGSNTNPEFLIPSLIHDVLCENHSYIGNDRNLSSRVFRSLLLSAGVSKVKSQIMYLAVDNYQRFCGWGK